MFKVTANKKKVVEKMKVLRQFLRHYPVYNLGSPDLTQEKSMTRHVKKVAALLCPRHAATDPNHC